MQTENCRRSVGGAQFFVLTITSLALELPKIPSNIVRGKNLVTVSSYRSATSYKNVISSRDRPILVKYEFQYFTCKYVSWTTPVVIDK